MNEEKEQPDTQSAPVGEPDKQEAEVETPATANAVPGNEENASESQPRQVNHLRDVERIVGAENYHENNIFNLFAEEKISFHELTINQGYEVNSDFQPSVEMFINNLPGKIAVVNTPVEEIGMGICLQIAAIHKDKPRYIVNIEDHWQITLDKLLEKFEQWYKDHKDKGACLIVQDRRFDKSRTERMILPLLKRGLGQDILFNRIQRLKLTFIYLCHADGLVTESTSCASPFFFNAYPVLMLVQQKYHQYQAKALEMSQKLWQIAQQTTKIKVSDDAETISYYKDISPDELERILDEEKAGYDVQAERERIGKQLREPLKNVLLFLVTFFEKIPLSEFTDLIKLYGEAYEADISGTKPILSYYNSWLENAHELTEACGIDIQTMPAYGHIPRYKSYGLQATIQKEHLLHLFETHYLPHVATRFHIACEYLYAKSTQPSKPFLAGLIKAGLVCSQAHASEGVINLALKLSDTLVSPEKSGQRKFLEQYLLEISEVIMQQPLEDGRARYYYDQKLAIPAGRKRMGWLLGKITLENYPDQLHLLRRVLNGSSKSERKYAMLAISGVLRVNLSQVWDVLQEVETWHTPEQPEPDISYSYILCYLLQLLSDEPGWEANVEMLDYQIIQQLLNNPGPEKLEVWLKKLVAHSKQATFQVYRDEYKAEIPDERLLTKRLQSDLVEVLAGVLAGLFILTEKCNTGIPTPLNLVSVAHAVGDLFQVKITYVRRALIRHMSTYNHLLAKTLDSRKRALLISKKRTIEKFIQCIPQK